MDETDHEGRERIARRLSRAGLASRRDAERMIQAGRVTVNGRRIESPALDVTASDRIEVDGKPLPQPEPARLWLYHKPAGLVTSAKDEKGRPGVFDSLPEGLPRVMSVGRLDLTSEGLLLLTNDGALKRQLELPSTGWLRKYRARVNGTPNEALLQPLRDGLEIAGERFQPMEIAIDRLQGANAWLTVALREGRNREVRRALETVGLVVNRLIRISYGPFRLGELQPGEVAEVKPKVLREQIGSAFLHENDKSAAGRRKPVRAGATPARPARSGEGTIANPYGDPSTSFRGRKRGKPGAPPAEAAAPEATPEAAPERPRRSRGAEGAAPGRRPRAQGEGARPHRARSGEESGAPARTRRPRTAERDRESGTGRAGKSGARPAEGATERPRRPRSAAGAAPARRPHAQGAGDGTRARRDDGPGAAARPRRARPAESDRGAGAESGHPAATKPRKPRAKPHREAGPDRPSGGKLPRGADRGRGRAAPSGSGPRAEPGSRSPADSGTDRDRPARSRNPRSPQSRSRDERPPDDAAAPRKPREPAARRPAEGTTPPPRARRPRAERPPETGRQDGPRGPQGGPPRPERKR